MIRIEHKKKPSFLQSKIVDLAIEKLTEFYSSKNRSQKRYDWPFNTEIDDQLKIYLNDVFFGKCGYCETKINPDLAKVDRYRPNNGVRDKNEYFQDLYWWLAFEWDNLIYSCKECNQYKANYFPIKGARALTQNHDLKREHKMLLNPYEDDSSKHLSYDDFGNIHPITDEGFQTIELLRLDRTYLVEDRRKAGKEIRDAVESLLSGLDDTLLLRDYLIKIYELEDYRIEFLSYKRWVLIKELEISPLLNDILRLGDFRKYEGWDERIEPNKTKFSNGDFITSDYFPIEYIHIKNFKSIEELTIDFKVDELGKRSWLFLLGENGVGKSSILQAIALGLKAERTLLDPYLIRSLIKKGKRTSEITIKERNSDNMIRTKLVRKDGSFDQSGNFNSYLIGYGSLRLSIDEIEGDYKRDISKISYENLFKPTKPLNDITKWLRSQHKNNINLFDRMAYSIKQLLPHDKSDTYLSINNGEIILGDSNTQFSELSDGYKSTITLAVDIMMKLSDVQSDMEKMSGIVLIDELGNQLHPRWQMRIVKQLRTVFPNVNFIVSTHHPLCLRGSEDGEIILLKNVEKEVVSIKNLPNPASLRVDQILGSEFFGLNSMIDPELEAKFNRYYELLGAHSTLSLRELDELDEIKTELRDEKHLGSSLREELMYAVIDTLLAKDVKFAKEIPNRMVLKERVIERVRKIWLDLNIKPNDQS
jgi:uncharacterized protein (TIGR02646 family)